jgi:hypothetical protein
VTAISSSASSIYLIAVSHPSQLEFKFILRSIYLELSSLFTIRTKQMNENSRKNKKVSKLKKLIICVISFGLLVTVVALVGVASVNEVSDMYMTRGS